MILFTFYNNGWVLLLAERFCYRVACLWAFSRISKQCGRGPEVDSRKGSPLHVGLWKAVLCEPGKNWEGIWWKSQSSGWARPCPSRPRTLETEDTATGNAALNIEQIEESTTQRMQASTIREDMQGEISSGEYIKSMAFKLIWASF